METVYKLNKLIKTGGSDSIRLPANLLKELDWKTDDNVQIIKSGEDIILRKVK